MSQIEKLYEKIRRKPTPTDILFDEADRLLRAYGFIQRQPSGGSSHFIYTHSEMPGFQLTIAKHGHHLKKGYVIAIAAAIEDIREIQGGNWDG